MRIGRPVRGLAERVWLVALAVAVWQLVTSATDETYFPPPTRIIDALHEVWFSGPASHAFLTGNAVDDFSSSLAHLFVGWAAAGAAGVAIGAAIGRSRVLNDLLDPVLQFLKQDRLLLQEFILFFQQVVLGLLGQARFGDVVDRKQQPRRADGPVVEVARIDHQGPTAFYGRLQEHLVGFDFSGARRRRCQQGAKLRDIPFAGAELENGLSGHRARRHVKISKKGVAHGDDAKVTIEQQQGGRREGDDGQCHAESGVR